MDLRATYREKQVLYQQIIFKIKPFLLPVAEDEIRHMLVNLVSLMTWFIPFVSDDDFSHMA